MARTGTMFWTGLIASKRIGDAASKLLLFVLADHVNADDESFHSIRRLAAEAEISPATARRRLAEMEERGLIARVRNRVPKEGGGTRMSTYTCRLLRDGFDRLPPVEVRLTPTEQAAVDAKSASRTAHRTALPGERAEPPNIDPPNLEPPNTPLPPTEPVDRFGEFWGAYPVPRHKPAALTAWAKAVKKAPADRIIRGAEAYRADPNRDDAYTMHPSTWLNNDCWDDPPLPARQRNGAGPQSRQQPVDQDRDAPSGQMWVHPDGEWRYHPPEASNAGR